MELSSSNIRKFLKFSQKKAFLIFREMDFFLYFRERKPRKNFYIFSKESFSYISGNEPPPPPPPVSGNRTFLYFRKQKP